MSARAGSCAPELATAPADSAAGSSAPAARGDQSPGSRERMVRSAALLFREHGYSGTGFRDVIEHSGAPRGSIYHHFPDGKAQLAAEAVAWAADAVAARLDAALAQERDAAGVLRAFLDQWREVLERSDFRAGCPIVAVTVETDVPAELVAAAAAAFDGWQQLLTARLERAGIPAERATGLATLAVSAIEGAVVLCRARRDTQPLDAVERELARAIEAARG